MSTFVQCTKRVTNVLLAEKPFSLHRFKCLFSSKDHDVSPHDINSWSFPGYEGSIEQTCDIEATDGPKG